MNKLMRFDVFIRQKRTMAKATQHWVASADRSYFPVYEFRPATPLADRQAHGLLERQTNARCCITLAINVLTGLPFPRFFRFDVTG